MNSGHRALIQASFRRVLTVADLAVELFSRRLYLLDPALWHILGAGERRQQQALVRMLARAVEELDRFEQLAGTLEAVARRGVGEGVQEAHLDTIAETLLWTLQQVLGDAYLPGVEAAWRTACALLVGRMKGAAIAQAIEPVTLRRIRRSSCPELVQGARRSFAALPADELDELDETDEADELDEEDDDMDMGRFAELPPPPGSARLQAMPLSSRLPPPSR
jgi:hemoglobin-like flavoprotein